MLSKSYLLAGALCVSSFAFAASPSIGSVTARGETKIDNYEVRGSGTVFDGSVVETGQSISSSADLRLENSGEITLLRDSRGTLYRGRVVLQHGTAQLGLENSFCIEANGLVVAPTDQHTSGAVSIDPANSVTVEAKNGTLEIRDSFGDVVARVHPGHPLTFASLAGKPSAEFSAVGTVSSENANYFLSSADTGLKYEMKGDNLESYAGASVAVTGVLEQTAPSTDASGVLLVGSIQSSEGDMLLGKSADARAVIRGLSISPAVVSAGTRVCPPSPLEACCPGIPYPLCCNPLPTSQCTHSN